MKAPRLVLVVEDDPAFQDAIRRRLVQREFEVVTALDYRTALQRLEVGLPNLVCIDLELPNESGYELCERIRWTPALSYVPILVMSERGFPEDMAHAEDAGANAFLKKPFPLHLLTDTIDDLLVGPRESRRDVRRLRSC